MKQGFDNILGSKTFKMLKKSVLNGGHPYVEIGGIKWATMNLGATSVTDYGLYFQWGDTQGYTASQVGYDEGQKYFGWADYKYGNGLTFTKYTKYGLQTLEASDDAVHAAWGGSWRMPTLDEFADLIQSVNTAWRENYQGSGVSGLVLTDKTDSSKVLFFPACGYAYGGSVSYVGIHGGCWSNSLSADCGEQIAYGLRFYGSGVSWKCNGFRSYGFAVRGVLCA